METKIEVTSEDGAKEQELPQISEQAKGVSTALASMQETIKGLVDVVSKVEEENKQLKARIKVLQKRANQAVARPSLALSLSFGSTEELFGGVDNKRKDEQNIRFRTNLLSPGGNSGKVEIKPDDDAKSTSTSANGNVNVTVNEFEQYLNATEIKQATAEMSKCKTIEQKHQTVWSNVCKFCKKSQATKAMGYLSVFGKEYDINYRNMEEDGMTLVHMLCNAESANILVLRFVLINFVNVDVWVRTKSNGYTALDIASIYQQQECIEALLGYAMSNDYISKEWKEVHNTSEEWQEYQNVISTFDEYLKKTSGSVVYEKLMQSLEECLVRLMEDKKGIPMQLFYLVWCYHKNTLRNKKIEYYEQMKKYKAQKGKSNAKHARSSSSEITKPTKMKYTLLETKLWKSLKEQLAQVFDWQNIYRAPTQWYWFQYNFLNNPMWLDAPEEKIEEEEKENEKNAKAKEKEKKSDSDESTDGLMIDELCTIAKGEMNHGSNMLEQVMKGLIEGSEKSEQCWQKIVEYQYKNPVYRGKQQVRQDAIPEGLQCEVEAIELQQVSLMSKTYNYDAKYEYDYNNYVSQLCIRAHSLNESFQESVQLLFKEQLESKKVKYSAGPVKTVQKVREKAYNYYRDCQFPTTAQVVDMVRCSLVFGSIEEYWQGIEQLSKLNDTDESSNGDNATNPPVPKLSLMRCLNQCAEMKKGKHYRETTSKSKLPVPAAYVDIKWNVIISVEQKDKEAIGIVGEIVFVLKPMSDYQKRSTELVQVLKLKEKIEKSLQINLPFEKRLRIAGTNPDLLAPLLIKEPHHFTEECIRAKDAFGKTLLTRFLQNKDTPADLVGRYIACIPKPLMSEIWKAKIDAGRTPLMLILQYHNADIIKTVLESIPNYLRDELFKEKNNDGWTPLMLATRYQTYESIQAIIPFIPKDPLMWQSISTKGLHVLHCICQNENEDAHKSLKDLLEVIPEHIRTKLVNTANKDGKKPMYFAMLKANQKNGTSSVLAEMFPNEKEAKTSE